MDYMMVTYARDDVPGFNKVAAVCEKDIKSIFPTVSLVNYSTQAWVAFNFLIFPIDVRNVKGLLTFWLNEVGALCEEDIKSIFPTLSSYPIATAKQTR